MFAWKDSSSHTDRDSLKNSVIMKATMPFFRARGTGEVCLYSSESPIFFLFPSSTSFYFSPQHYKPVLRKNIIKNISGNDADDIFMFIFVHYCHHTVYSQLRLRAHLFPNLSLRRENLQILKLKFKKNENQSPRCYIWFDGGGRQTR